MSFYLMMNIDVKELEEFLEKNHNFNWERDYYGDNPRVFGFVFDHNRNQYSLLTSEVSYTQTLGCIGVRDVKEGWGSPDMVERIITAFKEAEFDYEYSTPSEAPVFITRENLGEFLALLKIAEQDRILIESHVEVII